MGLHRDGQRWNLPEDLVEERRSVRQLSVILALTFQSSILGDTFSGDLSGEPLASSTDLAKNCRPIVFLARKLFTCL